MELFPYSLALIFLALFFYEHYQKKKLRSELDRSREARAEELVGKGKLSELRLMAAGIAHEISNPLMIISGNVQRLQRSATPDLTEPLRKISANTDRIAKIIQGLRTYTLRNQSEDERFIPLKDMVEEVLLFCGQRLKNHHVDLRIFDLDGVYVTGHRGQLEQAFLNLINHSFEAVDDLPDKWIDIHAEKIRDRVFVYFRHSGAAQDFQKETLEKLLSDGNGKPGLALVRSIAQSNAGDFHYLEGEGHPTFQLELPRAPLMGIKPRNLQDELQ